MVNNAVLPDRDDICNILQNEDLLTLPDTETDVLKQHFYVGVAKGYFLEWDDHIWAAEPRSKQGCCRFAGQMVYNEALSTVEAAKHVRNRFCAGI